MQLSPTLRFYNFWQLGSLQVCCSNFILYLSLASGLLARDTQVLYTDFSASRQRRLLAFPRCVWVATLTPNSDSAATLNRRFYYSPDSHAAFSCDSKCTTPWVWRLTALHHIGRPLWYSSYPQVSLFRFVPSTFRHFSAWTSHSICTELSTPIFIF